LLESDAALSVDGGNLSIWTEQFAIEAQVKGSGEQFDRFSPLALGAVRALVMMFGSLIVAMGDTPQLLYLVRLVGAAVRELAIQASLDWPVAMGGQWTDVPAEIVNLGPDSFRVSTQWGTVTLTLPDVHSFVERLDQHQMAHMRELVTMFIWLAHAVCERPKLRLYIAELEPTVAAVDRLAEAVQMCQADMLSRTELTATFAECMSVRAEDLCTCGQGN
jgi:hypothetical protein